jgi:hypothetical protein
MATPFDCPPLSMPTPAARPPAFVSPPAPFVDPPVEITLLEFAPAILLELAPASSLELTPVCPPDPDGPDTLLLPPPPAAGLPTLDDGAAAGSKALFCEVPVLPAADIAVLGSSPGTSSGRSCDDAHAAIENTIQELMAIARDKDIARRGP